MSKKIAVVTGAAQGLGFAIAELLSAADHKVILLDRNEKQLQAATEKLVQSGKEAHGVYIDLSITESIHGVIDEIQKEFGKIHVLVNNAGVNFVKPMDQVKESDWDFVMNINLKAAFFMIQSAAPFMANGGSIINISSVAANSPRPLSVAYAASKAGIISLTKTASIVLAPRRIRVNAVCPGAMETDLLSKMAEDMSGLSSNTPEQSLKNYVGDIPLGRISAPEDVAKAVEFLASDNANYITGQALNVCGGWTVR
jgi:NAD(P)-dependent dehydrogenase (short-subunit alcohol dehydrogenase family)